MRKLITVLTMVFAVAILFQSCATTSKVTEQPRKDPFEELWLGQYNFAVVKYQQAKENINSTFDHIENPELRKINERAREADIMFLPSYISDIKWICRELDRLEVEHTHWGEIIDEQ